jgi:hypothetical protein
MGQGHRGIGAAAEKLNGERPTGVGLTDCRSIARCGGQDECQAAHADGSIRRV